MATRLGRAELGTLDAMGQTFGIGPVLSIAFASYLVAGHAGGATPLVVLVAFAGALALGLVFALFARRYAAVGAVYEYLGAVTGPGRTLAVAGAYFLVSFVAASGALLGSLLIQAFCTTRLGVDPGWWTGGLAIVAVVTVLLHHDVRWSTRSLLGLTAVSAAAILVLAVHSILTQDNTLRPFSPGSGDVLDGLLFGVQLFVGLEAATCLGQETADPRRSIPRAILAGMVACGVFYVLVAYGFTIAFGVDQVGATWGSSPLAVVGLADAQVGRLLGSVILLGIIVDLVAYLLAVGNLAARGLFALARDGLLPRPLARVSRHGTPTAGIVAFAAANLVLLAVGAGYPADRLVPVQATAAGALYVILATYALVCVGAAALLRAEAAPRAAYLLPVLGAAVPVLGLYGALVPFPEGPQRGGLVLALATVAAAATWALWLLRARPGRVAAAEGLRATAVPAKGV